MGCDSVVWGDFIMSGGVFHLKEFEILLISMIAE